MPPHHYQYSGGVSRSNVRSIGCALYMIGFSIFLIIGGGAMFGFSRFIKKKSNEPPFDSDFFKKNRSNAPDIIGTIGAIVLGIGCIMFAIAFIMRIVYCSRAREQEQRRHAEQQNPLSIAGAQPLPSAYPHQPPSQNVYPPDGTYPTQQVGSSIPMQTQYQYPAQPTDYPPPPYSNAPPISSYQYHTPTYSQSVTPPNAILQDSGDIEKQPLQKN